MVFLIIVCYLHLTRHLTFHQDASSSFPPFGIWLLSNPFHLSSDPKTLLFGLYRDYTKNPPKTNMEPKNEPLEMEIPIKNHHFQVSMWIFRGVPHNKDPHLPTRMSTKVFFSSLLIWSWKLRKPRSPAVCDQNRSPCKKHLANIEPPCQRWEREVYIQVVGLFKTRKSPWVFLSNSNSTRVGKKADDMYIISTYLV